MEKVVVELKNCYGIGELNTEFDFSRAKLHAIYASNGTMKSCLARTFSDLQTGGSTTDRIFKDRTTVRNIKDQAGTELTANQVAVFGPDGGKGNTNSAVSTLLVSQTLRTEYENLQKDVTEIQNVLGASLFRRVKGKTKEDPARAITSVFSAPDFITALHRIEKEVTDIEDFEFENLEYDVIFNAGFLEAIGNSDVKSALDEYISKYNQLLESSTYFSKEVFNYYNAETVSDQLKKNGFFKAKHSIKLNGEEPTEIGDEKELAALIAREKAAVLENSELKDKFDKIEKALNKNVGIRDGIDYLMSMPELIVKLSEPTKLKQQFWLAQLKREFDSFKEVLRVDNDSLRRRRDIEEIARAQATQWEKIISEFNNRFDVPFRLILKNKEMVILGQLLPELGFEYCDATNTLPVVKDTLLECLSVGEKRAFHILNIIFEIEQIKLGGQNALLIFDDVADSFDYANKFAILQYIQDTVRSGNCKVLILTHNFDFLRTIQSRFGKHDAICRLASKDQGIISLTAMDTLENFLVREVQQKFYTCPQAMIASIPFLRNISEYSLGKRSAEYMTLTSLLHLKPTTQTLTCGDLDGIFRMIFPKVSGVMDVALSNEPVFDVICRESLTPDDPADVLCLSKKVILSIRIRLAAEIFLGRALPPALQIAPPREPQTQYFIRVYKKLPNADPAIIKLLDKVQLMTPEAIHLNSFMYEPLIDMSISHLRKLHDEIVQI